MAFLRVVEVFPPVFPAIGERNKHIDLEETVERFIEEVGSIRQYADLILVANVKKPDLAKLTTLETAILLQDRLKIAAAPVLVVRDMNRPQFLSTVLTGMAFGLDSMMVAWGDRYPRSAKSSNIRDFSSLKVALQQSSTLKGRAHSSVRFMAPVDLNALQVPGGVALARGRVKAGADLLLAQPPTTDAGGVFESHASLLDRAHLADKTLLSVFPFRDSLDVKGCEKYFGWRLPQSLHEAAAGGAPSLLRIGREVVNRLRADRFPGVYLVTRGTPGIAAKLLS